MAEPIQYPLTADVDDKGPSYSKFLSQVPPVLTPDLAVEQKLNFRKRFAFDKRRHNETAQMIKKFEGEYKYTNEDAETGEGMLRVESGVFTLQFTQPVNLLELTIFRPAGDAAFDRFGRGRNRKRKQRHQRNQAMHYDARNGNINVGSNTNVTSSYVYYDDESVSADGRSGVTQKEARSASGQGHVNESCVQSCALPWLDGDCALRNNTSPAPRKNDPVQIVQVAGGRQKG